MIQIFIKLVSVSITEKHNQNENFLHWDIFVCSLLHSFGCKSSLSFEKKSFWCCDPSAQHDNSWNDAKMGAKITGKFLENRTILYAKEKIFCQPKAKLAIFPLSKISPKKSLLIQRPVEKEKKLKKLEIFGFKFYSIHWSILLVQTSITLLRNKENIR